MAVDGSTGEVDPTFDTHEAMRRAREDALRDMEEEEGREETVKDKFFRDMRIQFTASFLVHNIRTDGNEHGIAKEIAGNPDEAIGKMYQELTDQFDSDDGWGPPSIILDEEPSLVLPGLGMPLAVDLRALFEGAAGSGHCDTCGDPDACKDPEHCIQNPRPPIIPM